MMTKAKIGDVVGNVYSMDILSKIGDVPMPSYSIDGKTAIVAEDKPVRITMNIF